MKRLKIKLNSLWNLLWCDEWVIYTIGRKNGDSYKAERMVVADIIDYCAETHTEYCDDVIDRTQADVNLKTVKQILNN